MPQTLPTGLSNNEKLDYLLLLLQNLPPRYIPDGSQYYNFIKYKPNDEDIDLTGTEQGALNRTLEVAFGSRVKGPVEFKERGPGLDALVDVLRRTITGDAGENVLLWKWVDDLSTACEAAYNKADRNLPSVRRQAKRPVRGEETGAESDDADRPRPSTRKKAKVTVLPDDEEDMSMSGSDGASLAPLPEDSDSDFSEGVSGAMMELDDESEGDPESADERPAKGKAVAVSRPSTQQAPIRKRKSALTKAAKHAAHIKSVAPVTAQKWSWPPNDLRDDPLPPPEGNHGGAPRDAMAHSLAVRCYTISTNEERWRCLQPGCHTSWSGHLQPKRVIKHAAYRCKSIPSELHALVLKHCASYSLSARVAKLDEDAPELSDDESKPAKKAASGSLLAMAQAGGKEALQLRFDHRAVILVCDAGLPAALLDRPTWKSLITTANRALVPMSSTKFADHYLPAEAAHALQASYDRLSKLQNLTISFDGSTNKLVETAYTIHISEPVTRHAHLIAGDEQSGTPHTAEYLVEIQEKVMKRIGPWRFVLVISDDTGAPRLARQMLTERYPWLHAINDPVHHLHNTIKDICSLSYFQVMISSLRLLVRFFKKSLLAAQHLHSQRLLDGKSRGLQKNNRTRFALITRMGNSALYNLDSVKTVVDKNIVLTSAKERRTYAFLRNEQLFGNFRLHLRQLLAVTIPASKALKCLESPHCNPGDTYKFWLAVMATLRDLFDSNDDGLGLPNLVIRDITRIMNRRFKQMFDGQNHALFKAALFVDPVWVSSPLWRKKDANVLAASTRNAARPMPQMSPLPGNDADLRKAIPNLVEIGTFLGNMLKAHIQAAPGGGFASFGTPEAVRDAFQAQFIAYTRQDYLFNRPVTRGALAYWKSLQHLPDAKLMAVVAMKLLSMVGNSMAEERTVSLFTWINDNNRGSMSTSTMVQYAQVKQHHMREQAEPTRKPTVLKFRELAAQIRTEVLGVPQEDMSVAQPGSSTASGATETREAAEAPTAAPADAATGEDKDPLEELFDEVDGHDIDTDLANDDDTASDAFEPAQVHHLDLLSPLLRDLLSDIPVEGATWPMAKTVPTQEGEAAGERMNVDDVDFTFV